MRILWLNANLLLPLDKGGRIRTWHLMRHLARRHEITYLTFANAAEAEAHRPAMRQVCSELVNVPWHDAAKGSLRFYAGVARAPRRSAALRGGEVPVGGVSPRGRRAARSSRLRSRGLRFPGAGGEPAADAAVPVDPVHPQRGSRDLAAARRERGAAAVAPALPAAMAADAALRGADAGALRSAPGRVRGRRTDVPAALRRRGAGTDRRGRDRRRHQLLHPDARDVRAPEAPGVRRLHGLDAERGRGAVLLPRGAAACPRGRARRDAVDRRPGADAGGEAAGAGGRHRRHRHRRRRPHLPRAGLRDDRPPAGRRRHAPEDLRGDGRRQGGHLHHHRRRRPARPNRAGTC